MDTYTIPVSRRFPCPLCPKRLGSKSTLKKHVNVTHSTARPYSCKNPGCDATFKRSDQVLSHTRYFHGEGPPPPVPCEFCGKSFSSRNAKENHLKLIHLKETEYSCPHPGCTIAVSCSSSLKIHLATHLPREERIIFECPHKTCEATFLTKNAMQNHHRTFHEGKGFKCSQCGKVVSSQRLLVIHRLTHTSDKNFGCTLCPKFYKNKWSLSKHMEIIHEGKISTNTRTWSCSNCSKTLTSKQSLNLHAQTHLPDEERQSLKRHQCPHCPKKFEKLCRLNLHLRTVHNPKKSKAFLCPQCGKRYDNQNYLEQHIGYMHRRTHKRCYFCGKLNSSMMFHLRTHTLEKPYSHTCPQCSKRFMGESQLARHVEAMHNNREMRKAWPCEECARIFITRTGWRSHVQIKHRGILRFGCNLCPKRTSSMADLERHVSIHHTKELPFPCGVEGCGFRTRNKRCLRIHRQSGTHDNKKLKCYFCQELNCAKKHHFDEADHTYNCPSCDVRIKNKALFLRHVKSHVPKPRVSCYFCSKLYSGIFRHMRTHTKEKAHPCTQCGMDFGSPTELRAHTMNKHTPREPRRSHFCYVPGCWKSYFSAKVLKQHQDDHMTAKFGCKICGHLSFSIKDLAQHELSHGKATVYRCSSCSYCCKRRADLDQHLRTLGHGGVSKREKLPCYFCNKDLVDFRSLTMHMRLSHSVH